MFDETSAALRFPFRKDLLSEAEILNLLSDSDPENRKIAGKSLSEILVAELKKLGLSDCRIEGRNSNDWKLVDTLDIIVHIFHPEKREFYDLEKMWSEEIPKEKAMI